MKWIIKKSELPLKLVDFLKFKLSLSKKAARELIENGKCSLNNRIERFANATLMPHDSVCIETTEDPSIPLYTKNNILFEDPWILAYNKAPQISSEDTQFLKAIQNDFPSAELVHRLDKGTTGVLLFAKTEEAKKTLEQLFRKREIEKTYLALVDGVVKKAKGEIESTLGVHHKEEGKVIWGKVEGKEGLYALTLWERVEIYPCASLLKCYPKTGRTHQIRIHLSSIGHPILGDFQYGKNFLCQECPSRVMLHASTLHFTHPFTQQKMTITSSPPLDFQTLSTRLKNLR